MLFKRISIDHYTEMLTWSKEHLESLHTMKKQAQKQYDDYKAEYPELLPLVTALLEKITHQIDEATSSQRKYQVALDKLTK
jgi:flagellar biosynthesis/type III secretory pathway protein FliH